MIFILISIFHYFDWSIFIHDLFLFVVITWDTIIVSKEFETEAYFLYLGDNIFFLVLVFLKNMFCKRWKRTQILLVFPFIIIAFFREGEGQYWFYRRIRVSRNKEQRVLRNLRHQNNTASYNNILFKLSWVELTELINNTKKIRLLTRGIFFNCYKIRHITCSWIWRKHFICNCSYCLVWISVWNVDIKN